MALLGIDEVGRGPWAGPLVIGAVILNAPKTRHDLALETEDFLTATPLGDCWDDLTDSKRLTKHSREILAEKINERAFATSLGWVPASEVDEVGLAAALRLAAKRAVANCLEKAGIENASSFVGGNQNLDFPSDFPVDEIIIDGTVNFLRGTPLEKRTSILPKADLLIKEVSAASIIAKVARDNYMADIAADYPAYGFERHVGYGTAAHKQALETFGPCPEHRTSVRPVAKVIGLEEKARAARKNTTAVGQAAEDVVAEHLRQEGHKILARNFKTRFYEIDIISATRDRIYFTEVKYRKSPFYGAPLEAIDRKKRIQMSYAADSFLTYLAHRLNRTPDSLPSPVLAVASVSGPELNFDDWLPMV